LILGHVGAHGSVFDFGTAYSHRRALGPTDKRAAARSLALAEFSSCDGFRSIAETEIVQTEGRRLPDPNAKRVEPGTRML
jgi:hypothetical protein